MTKAQWRGVFPALLTPFDKNDTVDIPLFIKNLEAQEAAGVNGVIIGGSLGEASTVLPEEVEQLIKAAKANTKLPVVVNIAEQSTSVAIGLAQKFEQLGADGIMLLPPMRYKADDEETVEYFLAVARSTNLPIMIYNNPVDYKIEVTIAMFEKLAEQPNIVAIKESTRDTTNIIRLKNKFGDRFSISNGVDTLAVEALALGADGWVAGLVDAFPAETVAIFKLVKAGRMNEARCIYQWFMPVLELDIHPKLVQYIKLAASKTGIGSEYVRAPRKIIQGSERERVLNIIETALQNRPQLPDYKSL